MDYSTFFHWSAVHIGSSALQSSFMLACWALYSVTAKHLQNLRSTSESSKVENSPQLSLVFSLPCYQSTYRSDDKLFSISRLKVKSKTRTVLIRNMHFAEDAALAVHSEGQLQSLMNGFYKACDLFSLTISLQMTQITCQWTAIPPATIVKDHQIEVVNQFT